MIDSFPYDTILVLLLFETASTNEDDVPFDVSLWYGATSTTTERLALRSMERTGVASDVPAAGMAEASAETMARERKKYIFVNFVSSDVSDHFGVMTGASFE